MILGPTRGHGPADATGHDRFQRWALLAVVITATLAYANALANGFVLDDAPIVRNNPLVTSPGQAWRAFAMPYWPDRVGAGQYRPLGIVSFAMDWALSGGNPRWFHAVNVVWHALTTAAVWMLAAELLMPTAALIAGLTFAVHPVHVEAVANVVGRLECMAAVGVLGALIAHRRGRRSAPLWLALGVFSKESAIVFIGLAAAHDVLLTENWRETLQARRWWYASYGVVVLAYAVTLAAVFHDRALAMEARVLIGTTTLERWALVATVIPHYARLLLVPAELSASYAPNVIMPDGGLSAGAVLGVAVLMLVVIAFVAAVRSRGWPVMAFAILWVPIALSPVSNVFFASGILLAERTLYLASVGVCLGVGAIAERMLVTRRTAALTTIAVVLLAFAGRTWMRTPVWRDDRTWLVTLLADHPESYEGHRTAGGILKFAGQLDHAARELTIARELYPRDPLVYREAADVALRQQRTQLAAALRDSARIAPTLPLPRR
jgi:protein O-mannosyl-transferase